MLALIAGIAWWFTVGTELYRDYLDYRALQQTNQYELEQARLAAGSEELPGLVTILGDSRFKHWARIHQIEVLADGRYISYGADGTVRLWHADGSVSNTYAADAMSVSPGGSYYAISNTGLLHIFDASNDKLVHKLDLFLDDQRATFSLDRNGNHVAYCDHDRIIVHNFETNSNVMDIHKDDIRKQLNMVDSGLGFLELLLSPDAKRLVFTAGSRMACIDVTTGLVTLHLPEGFDGQNRAVVRHIRFDKTGTKVICNNVSSRLGLIDLETNEVQTADFRGRKYRYFGGAGISTDGERLMCLGRERLYVVDTETLDYEFFDIEGIAVRPSPSMAVDGQRLLFTSGAHTIRRLDLKTKALESSDPSWDINCIDFSPDKEHLVAGCSDGTIRFFEIGNWQQTKDVDTANLAVDSIKFSSDGQYIGATCERSKSVRVFKTKTLSEVSFLGNVSWVKQSITFTPQNELVWQDNLSNLIQILDVESLQKLKVLNTAQASNAIQSPTTPRPNAIMGRSPYVTKDGKWLLTSNQYHSISVWNIEQERWVGYIGMQGNQWGMPEHTFFVSPDEKSIATIGVKTPVQIHDLGDLSKVTPDSTLKQKPMELNGNFGQDARVAFSRNGKFILTTGRTGSIKIWDRGNGRLLKKIKIATEGSQVTEIKISMDDRYFATTNGNGSAYVFRMPDYHDLPDLRKNK